MTKFISGFAEADKILRQLSPQIQNKVLQSAVSSSARVVAKSVRQNAPKGSGKQSPSSTRYGRLSRNIKVEVLRRAKAKGRRGARVSTGNAFWAIFLEFGTSRMAARPFFRPAVEASKETATIIMRTALGSGITIEVNKLIAKHAIKGRGR